MKILNNLSGLKEKTMNTPNRLLMLTVLFSFFALAGCDKPAEEIKPTPVEKIKWVHISAGLDHSLAIDSEGTLYTWGNNQYGQLGDGTITSRSSPTKIGTKNDWKYIATGIGHSLAINEAGELYAWGRNNFGQVGDGVGRNKLVPTRMGITSQWKRIAATIRIF